MKRTITLLTVLVLTATSSFGQEYKNAIKTNPIGMFASQFQLQYERALSEKFSAQLSLGYINRGVTSNFGYSARTTGTIIIPELKYYFTESLNGPYVSAFGRFRPTKLDVDYSEDNTSYVDKNFAYGGGLLFGYQILVSEGFLVDVFVGPQMKSIDSSRTYDDENVTDADLDVVPTFKRVEAGGLGVRLGVNLGYAF